MLFRPRGSGGSQFVGNVVRWGEYAMLIVTRWSGSAPIHWIPDDHDTIVCPD